MTDLTGRRALVTGGGGGLGADLARGLAAAGAEVWIAGRRAETLEAVADSFAAAPSEILASTFAAQASGAGVEPHSAATAHGDRPVLERSIHPVVADVTDEASVIAMFETTGPCDIVIANAGASESAPFARTSLTAWERMISVNLTGSFLTLREGARQMDGWGRLIAVASTAGLKGYGYVSAYAAAKHGVVGMVKSAALEMARSGVTVNALCPGFLDTEMTAASIANITAKTGMSAEAARASLEKMSPQNRLIRPAEVTAAALWLCAPGSEGITGQAISISGGEA